MSELTPLVSVCCITYNHERYLAQTIESVLMQQTTFSVEIVIGEDCSTDATRSIALEYASRYPGRLKVLTPTTNLGVMPNLMATMATCRGQYIALVEGDDYWTDPQKLQTQVDLLEANPDCGFCFHDAETFEDGTDSVLWTFSEQFAHILPAINSPLRRFSHYDIVKSGWFIPTASILFRKSSLPSPLPDWFAGVYSGDYTLHLLSTRNGPALYLPRLMSRYRLHNKSMGRVNVGTAHHIEKYLFQTRMFRQHAILPAYSKYADVLLSNQYYRYARHLGDKGQRWKQLQFLAKASLLNLQRIPLYLEKVKKFF